MDKINFCNEMAEILDVESVSVESILGEFEQWDSLAMLSTLAMADAKYGVTIRSVEVRGAVTVGDLADLVEQKHKNAIALV